jgi:hypothetical protein
VFATANNTISRKENRNIEDKITIFSPGIPSMVRPPKVMTTKIRIEIRSFGEIMHLNGYI